MSRDSLRLSPNNSNFQGTHGQVLARLGKYEEAIKFLQSALLRLNDGRLHATLVEVARELNMDELADRHYNILGSQQK